MNSNDYGSVREQKAVLLRCHYPYGKSQTWMPMDLNKVAGMLECSGIRTDIIDLNLQPLPENLDGYDYIGVGVIGAPYIPVSVDLVQKVKKTGGTIFIGGQGVEYFSDEEFKKLYGDCTQVRNSRDLEKIIGRKLPSVYDVSVAERISNVDSDTLGSYLKGELSFFVSQGCKYSCHFCAATRTRPGTKISEQFSNTAEEDLDALCESARSLGIEELHMYLTSLDLFQTPSKFKNILAVFSSARERYGIAFDLRGLSRIDSFLNAPEQEPDIYRLMQEAGLRTIGFGVDGTSEKIWRSQHKGNKTLSDADEAFETCIAFGVTPEALMVMGFHDASGVPIDDTESLRKNVEYSLEVAEKYGVVSRPHVAKDVSPGNNGWTNPVWAHQRARMLENPELFKCLDFVAIASEITHPDEAFRRQVNEAYMDIITELTPRGLCGTTPIMPPTDDAYQTKVASVFNMLVPFDK